MLTICDLKSGDISSIMFVQSSEIKHAIIVSYLLPALRLRAWNDDFVSSQSGRFATFQLSASKISSDK